VDIGTRVNNTSIWVHIHLYKRTTKRIQNLNSELRRLRAKAKAMKPGLDDIHALEEMYPEEKAIIWGRTEYI